jgi:DNA end-binding protein Ku
MQAIWKGAISFGLVSIPVQLYSATEEKNIRFHQVHRNDGGRVRYQRICSVDGEQVSYQEIAKGYEIGKDEMVVLTDEDLADLPLATSRAIEVLEFVPTGQLDPIMFHKTYYLEPTTTSTKPYLLLRDALTSSDRVAVVKVALRQREQLGTLRVRDRVMMLTTLLWPDEIRRPEFGFLEAEPQARPAEVAMARSLLDTMSADFTPDAYTDNYREAIQALIEAKIEGREVVAPAEPAAGPAPAIDLMAALRASVERARAARTGDTPPPEGPAVEPTPISAKPRKSTQRTAPQRGTSQQTTSRRKAPARKPRAA